MLSLRKRILVIILAFVTVVTVILVMLFSRRGEEEVVEDTTIPPQVITELSPIENVEFRRPESIPGSIESPVLTPDEIYAKQQARIFVERFWTYSNQNDNRHIEDALSLALPSMHAWILSQSSEQADIYAGVTTEVLSARVVSYTPEATRVEVGAQQTTQQATSDGGITRASSIITAEVDLVKQGAEWLVSGVWIQ
jgi:hypothetical protein